MKIIGCGNRDRGDDQAGIVVARRLRDLGFEAETHSGDALALLDRWRSDDDVIVVDAVVSGAPLGTIRLWDVAPLGEELPDFAADGAVSSHAFDIRKAIELGRTLGKLPSRLRIWGIEGRQFERGARISPAVLGAVDLVIQRIRSEVPFP